MSLNCVIIQLIMAIKPAHPPLISGNEVTWPRGADLPYLSIFCHDFVVNFQTGCRVCPGWARQSDEAGTAPAPQLRGAFSAPEGGACCQQVTIFGDNIDGRP